MHPSSSSSSSQKSMGSSGLTRYGSAPSSLLANVVDSVIGSSGIGSSPNSNPHIVGHYFTSDSSESTGKVNSSGNPHGCHGHGSYGGGSSSLLRQRSSPAGFLDHAMAENGFSLTRGTKNYNSTGVCSSGPGVSRLKSQLSFTRQDPLTKISEVNEDLVDGVSSSSAQQNGTHSFSSVFGIDAWDNSNSIAFSSQPIKRAKNIDGDLYNCLNALETQFTLPQTALEMTAVERMLNIPEDSVPCKIRAKRGFATHPRSIAERERRTRISGKLKKLQDLVPNMDKQTSYADMLDLAVQHIKGLQTEVQKLHQDLDSCTCGCKPSS